MFKNIKPKLIAIFILIILMVGAVRYVNYLMNQPLNIDLPTEFIYNGQKIALAWTDDNTGEDLIIQSDKKVYQGFNQVDVYFSITNINRRDQDMDIVFWVEDEEVKVEGIERLEAGEPERMQREGDSLSGAYADQPLALVFAQSSAYAPLRPDGLRVASAGTQAQDQIKSGKTNYYKATLKYPPMSQGEFFIEAFGKDTKCPIGHLVSCGTTYGHLDPWYLSDWSYRKRIDIEADQVMSNETNFPVLATTTDTDLIFTGNGGKVASSTGADIVFTDSDGETLLNYEREKYSSSTGEIAYWIKTDISSTTDKVIYMYYGNASMQTDLATTTGVWDDNYVGVWHLAHDGVATTTYPDFIDSTQYDNDGSSKNMNSDDLVDGQIDGSLDFDGTDDYVNCGTSPVTSDITVSAWVKLKSTSFKDGIVSAWNSGGWKFYLENSALPTKITLAYRNNPGTYYEKASTGTINSDRYYHVGFTFYGATQNVILYIDGSASGSGTGTDSSYPAKTFYIGYNNDNARWLDGKIDEVRISNAVRSAQWIETEYNNQSAVGEFLTFGAEEDNTPTEFISTIMQTGNGGDYQTLSGWEAALAPTGQTTDLTATTTRVFSGTGTGELSGDNTVELFRSNTYQYITAQVIATTSTQILVDNVLGIYDDGLVLQTGDQWRLASSSDNMFTVSGTGSELGDSAIAIAKIDGAWSSADTTAVTIDEWTTSATNYIKIYTTESARHDGKWDTSAYRHDYSGSNWVSFLVQEDFVRIEGLQMRHTSEGSGYTSVLHFSSSDTGNERFYVSHNIVSNEGTGATRTTFESDRNAVFYVWNNVFRSNGGGSTKGRVVRMYKGTFYFYNNVVEGGKDYGIVSGLSANVEHIKNCAVFNNSDDFYADPGGGAIFNNISHCASDDGDGTNAVTPADWLTVFVDYTNGDFHLKATDTDLKNVGANLSNDSNLSFQDDIDGDTRPASNWDIGADEAESAVEFVATIMQTAGEYSSLHDWEAAIDCDLTASSTRVYSIIATTSMIADAATVTTDSGASTATLIHQASSSQILLINISGSFDSGDYVTDASSNSVILSNNGNSAIAVGKIDGAWSSADTTAVVITDWTTSASNYIRIYTTTAARHGGKWDDGYRLTGSSGGKTMYIYESYVRIEGIVFNYASGYGIYVNGLDVGNSDIRISHCLGCGGYSRIILVSNVNATVKIWNFIGYDSNYTFQFQNQSHVYCYNCTAVDGSYEGFRCDVNDTCTLKNCLATGNTNYDFYGAANYTSASCNNASGDGTGDDLGSNGKANQTFNFLDETNDDFHLAGSDTAAKDAGVDLSGDSNLSFTDDIDGEERPAGASWDIGADEKKRATVINTPITNKYTDGLVGHWTFNGEDMDWASSTAEALDRSGNSNNGDVIGASAAIGISGQGLEFDGVDDYINVLDDDSLDMGTNDWTISAWIKLDMPISGLHIIAKKGATSPTGSPGYNFYYNADASVLKFGIATSTNRDVPVSSVISIEDNNWHHIVASADRGGSLYFYVDASPAGSGDISSFDGSDITSNVNFWIGTWNGSGTLDGLIDEVRIYDRALSASEILDLYQAGARKLQVNTPITNKQTSGLVGHWTFNGEDMDWASSTAEALDRSGNSNNGNVIGAKAVIGKVGQGLEFDGSGDYIDCGDDASLDINSTITISAWIYPTELRNHGVEFENVVSKRDGSTDENNINYEVRVGADYTGADDDVLHFAYRKDGSWHLWDTAGSASGLVSNQWQHIAFTFTYGTGSSVAYYLNGVDKSTLGSWKLGDGTATPNNDANPVRIGEGHGNTDYNGTIDEVRIYDRALSADEIGELYRVGARKMRF